VGEEAVHAHGAPIDPGLISLVMMLRFQGLSVNPEQIRHQLGNVTIGLPEMLRCSKAFGLKARVSATTWTRLAVTPMPALAALRDGGFLLLGKVAEDKIIVLEPGHPQPIAMAQAEFEASWDGRVLLMTKRASLGDLTRRFDITWFLAAVHKYRRLLSEVLIASFFLQLLPWSRRCFSRSSSIRCSCIAA
jgi:subfamily B ATP-binding cassette protein HlyB/CyaB